MDRVSEAAGSFAMRAAQGRRPWREEEKMQGRKTGAKAAKAASKVLRSKSTGKASKTAAGSALSQRAPKGGK
jgi:hypothetical protein